MTDVIRVLEAEKEACGTVCPPEENEAEKEGGMRTDDLLEDILAELKYGNRLAQGKLVMDALKLFAFVLFVIGLATVKIGVTTTVTAGGETCTKTAVYGVGESGK